jgi:outer membrane protein assembly factor BamE (lipoprotein component of BamABCDE complex)
VKIKNPSFALFAVIIIILAGCATTSETSDTPVRLGMLRDDLRYHYGEPLRIEKDGEGGEFWYYHFVSWKPYQTQESTSTVGFGERESTVSVGFGVSRESEERPIHVSPDGIVVEPLPAGKVVPR